jgi:putative transposase
MEPSKAVKEYKEELVKSQKQNERLTALVGKVTVEKEWLAKKRTNSVALQGIPGI